MPLADAKRQQIIDLAKSGHKRNAIAREVGCSPSTVSTVAKANGLGFDRSLSEVATKAHVADAKARRAALVLSVLGDLEEARLRLRETVSAREFQAAAQGMDALTRAYSNLMKLEPDDGGMEHARQGLGAIMAAITASVVGVPRMNPTTPAKE